MSTFYPEIILHEIISCQQQDFKIICKKVFRLKEVYTETVQEAIGEELDRGFHNFNSVTRQLQEYVAAYNKGDKALLFANLKSLMLEVDNICTINHLNKIITDLINELKNNGRVEDTVDEETCEPIYHIHAADKHIYYPYEYHQEVCIGIFYALGIKRIKEILSNYGKYFDDNYELKPRVDATILSTPVLQVAEQTKPNTNFAPHKLFWDEDITEFEPFFNNPNITLMDGTTSDRNQILSILKEVFTVGDYGGLKKNKKTAPAVNNTRVEISETLNWNGGTVLFAATFAPLISSDGRKTSSDSTLFFNFSKNGVYTPIGNVLHSLFVIKGNNGKRIAPSYLIQALKEYKPDQG